MVEIVFALSGKVIIYKRINKGPDAEKGKNID